MGLLFVCFWYYPGNSLVLKLTSISSNKEHKCFDSVNNLTNSLYIQHGLMIVDLQRIYCSTKILIFDIRESSPIHISFPQIIIRHTCERAHS